MNYENIDRFTMEAQIMNCWNVVEDLTMLANRNEGSLENIQAVTRIYQMKFEALWDTVEQLVAEGKVT